MVAFHQPNCTGRPLKIAFIGAGGIAQAHFRAVEAYSDLFEVLGACDPNPVAAEALAAKCGPQTGAFPSMEALYAAAGEQLDGVIICTPHYLHESGGAFFLERGIPVLIEKPVTCNLQELENLRTLERDGAFVQVGQMQRFDPEALWLRDFVQDSGKFGKAMSFDLNIWQNIEGYVQGNHSHWILDGRKAGGGICISVAVHPLDLLRFITGQDFTEVTAIGRFDPPFTNGAESSCSALFRMSGGLMGSLHASYKPTRVPYSQRMVLFGERGSLCQEAKTGEYSGRFLAASADPAIESFAAMYDGFEPIADQVKAVYPEVPKNAFVTQLLHFRQAILERRKPVQNTLEINYNTIAVLDAIAASLKSGRTETVQTPR